MIDSSNSNTMIGFEHEINQAEADASYINLYDGRGRKYGQKIGPKDTLLMAIDGEGRRSLVKRHNGNQLTKCTEWYRCNDVQAGAVIEIRFDIVHPEYLYLIPKTHK
jgi:hypothetical protein